MDTPCSAEYIGAMLCEKGTLYICKINIDPGQPSQSARSAYQRTSAPLNSLDYRTK